LRWVDAPVGQFDYVGVPGLEKIRCQAHIQLMFQSTLKTVGKVGVVLLTGVWPYGRYGWVVIIGACVVIAGVLHFVAP
jgi:hypothetical protein